MTTELLNDRPANKIQIGGDHYRSDYQHWDFVHEFGLDYYEGCASKYVTRRKRKRMEDLRKAQHFLHKRKEFPVMLRPVSAPEEVRIVQFCLANKLNVREMQIVGAIVERRYSDAIEQIEKLITEEV